MQSEAPLSSAQFGFQNHAGDQRLEILFPDHRLSSVPFNMLIVPERSAVARVRLLADFLAEEIARLPGIERR